MDWTKAKTILIIALIVTNMVLGINLYIDKKVMNTIGEDVIKETQIILKESKINIDTKKIPRKIKEMAVLDVEYDHIDSETINEMILNQSNRNRNELREKDVIQIAEDFLNQNGLLNKNTKLEDKDIRKEEDQYILPYKNFYEGIPLEECHMNCIIKNGQIIAIDRIWLNPIKQGKMKKRTIPSTTALLKFSTLKKEPAEEINIEDIRLVYWLETALYSREITSKATALPAWRITYNGGKTKYILAYEK